MAGDATKLVNGWKKKGNAFKKPARKFIEDKTREIKKNLDHEANKVKHFIEGELKKGGDKAKKLIEALKGPAD